MEQLWQVLGRSYIENAFGVATMNNAQADAQDPNTWEDDASKLTGLADHLHGHKYRLSRWELVEVNRIFFKVRALWPDLTKSPFQDIADVWSVLNTSNVPPRPTELWSLLGLASIDEKFSERLLDAAKISPDQLKVELAKPPAYSLEQAEITALTGLLQAATVDTAIGTIHPEIWVYDDDRGALQRLAAIMDAVLRGERSLRKAPCSGGHTRNKVSVDGLPYLHIGAPLIDSLSAEALSLELG